MLFVSFCLLLKKDVKCAQIETDQFILEAWWLNTSHGGKTPFEKKKKKLKEPKRTITKVVFEAK